MTREEAAYMVDCKHYGMEGMCYMKSGYNGGFHFSFACDGKCPRMNRWRKLKQTANDKT
jgi:hypothetical protein